MFRFLFLWKRPVLISGFSRFVNWIFHSQTWNGGRLAVPGAFPAYLDELKAMMFKNSWCARLRNGARAGHPRRHWTGRSFSLSGASAALLVAGLLSVGCRMSGVRMAAIDVAQPGWTMHQGQAVWHLGNASHPLLSPKQLSLNGSRGGASAVEIAGEVLVGTNADGEAVVQFSKPPFTLVMGRLSSNQWEVSFPARSQRFSGPGTPPGQIPWLQLPRVLAGLQPPVNWSWQPDALGWKLENRVTGEFLEGYFNE